MGEVADDREGVAGAAAHEEAPVHLGEFLGLVDDDVAVGPIAVGGGAVGEFAGVAFDEAVGEVFAVEEVGGAQVVFVVHMVGAVDQEVQDAFGVGDLGLAFAFGRGLLGGGVAAQQVGQLVEERDVGDGPRLAVLTVEGGVGCGGRQPFT